jgi:hypothetical protein
MKPKIYDCIQFFNELDLLEARLEYLSPYIDKFVIVESTINHCSVPKPLYFSDNKNRFSTYLDKIIHVVVTDCPPLNGDVFTIDNYLRNSIVKGLNNVYENDIVLISDLDEIPHHQWFEYLLSNHFKHGNALAFSHVHHVYWMNIVSLFHTFPGTIAVKKSTLNQFNPQFFRTRKDQLPRLTMGGWHLSYMGGVESIRHKFLNAGETLNKSEIPNEEVLREVLKKRLKEGQFNIRHNTDHPVTFITNPYLPTSITKEKYPQFFINSLDNI